MEDEAHDEVVYVPHCPHCNQKLHKLVKDKPMIFQCCRCEKKMTVDQVKEVEYHPIEIARVEGLLIENYIHCDLCIEELNPGDSPNQYKQLQIGFITEGGIQVYCERHNKNVLTMRIGGFFTGDTCTCGACGQ